MQFKRRCGDRDGAGGGGGNLIDVQEGLGRRDVVDLAAAKRALGTDSWAGRSDRTRDLRDTGFGTFAKSTSSDDVSNGGCCVIQVPFKVRIMTRFGSVERERRQPLMADFVRC